MPSTTPMLKAGCRASERMISSLAATWPSIVRARTERITIAITAHCNLRCKGCKYGRDFIPGAQLPLKIVEEWLAESAVALASEADWALKQEQMRSPCDARKLLWVGADGSVMLCYLTFPLGNLHERRLSEFICSSAHHEAARDAFKLNCPNCHCEAASRDEKHAPSFRKNSAEARHLLSAGR